MSNWFHSPRPRDEGASGPGPIVPQTSKIETTSLNPKENPDPRKIERTDGLTIHGRRNEYLDAREPSRSMRGNAQEHQELETTLRGKQQHPPRYENFENRETGNRKSSFPFKNVASSFENAEISPPLQSRTAQQFTPRGSVYGTKQSPSQTSVVSREVRDAGQSSPRFERPSRSYTNANPAKIVGLEGTPPSSRIPNFDSGIGAGPESYNESRPSRPHKTWRQGNGYSRSSADSTPSVQSFKSTIESVRGRSDVGKPLNESPRSHKRKLFFGFKKKDPDSSHTTSNDTIRKRRSASKERPRSRSRRRSNVERVTDFLGGKRSSRSQERRRAYGSMLPRSPSSSFSSSSSSSSSSKREPSPRLMKRKLIKKSQSQKRRHTYGSMLPCSPSSSSNSNSNSSSNSERDPSPHLVKRRSIEKSRSQEQKRTSNSMLPRSPSSSSSSSSEREQRSPFVRKNNMERRSSPPQPQVKCVSQYVSPPASRRDYAIGAKSSLPMKYHPSPSGQNGVCVSIERERRASRKPKSHLRMGGSPNLGTDSDSVSDDDVLGETMSKERFSYHLERWTEAIQTPDWELAVQHAKVLEENTSVDVARSRDVVASTPLIRELVLGSAESALETIKNLRNSGRHRFNSFNLIKTVALFKTKDYSGSNRSCNRLIKQMRENDRDMTAAFQLMAHILAELGQHADAAWYESKSIPDTRYEGHSRDPLPHRRRRRSRSRSRSISGDNDFELETGWVSYALDPEDRIDGRRHGHRRSTYI